MEAPTKKIMEVETFEETTEMTSKTTSEKTDDSIIPPGFIGPSGFSFPVNSVALVPTHFRIIHDQLSIKFLGTGFKNIDGTLLRLSVPSQPL